MVTRFACTVRIKQKFDFILTAFVHFSDSNTPDREISGVTTRPTESELSWILPDSSDPQVWNNKGSYEGFEPQLTLKEEDLIFSPRWGQDRGEREKMSTASDPVQSKRQCHPEDDFICSDEVCWKTTTH